MNILVQISTKQEISTNKKKCNNSPDYNFFQCIEDYYSDVRGCQFPWNINKASNIKICETYSDIYNTLWESESVENGANRDRFKLNQFLLMTNDSEKQCLVPCFVKTYSLQLEQWALWMNENKLSLQISLDSFMINHDEDYFKCDTTCIIGELGGNMGFFLGGSILLAIDIAFLGFQKITRDIDFPQFQHTK